MNSISISKYIKGFTIIELLVVVSIIGILSGIVLSIINPNTFKGKARDGVRMNDLAVIKGGLEQYYAENNIYPTVGTFSFGAAWTGYLKSVPADPLSTNTQYCYQRPNAQNYNLCATVEDTKNQKNGIAGCGTHCVTNPF